MSGFGLFLRGLLLQVGWNRERMQGLGLAWALLPLVARREPAAQAAFIRRHLAYVNTSPALSGVLLGAVAREEEGFLAAGTEAGEAAARVAATKRQLEGPLAALGDRVFWGWLRPLLGVVGALVLLFGAGAREAFAAGSGIPPRWAWASVLAGLAFYNGPYLVTRWRGTWRGLAIVTRADGEAGALSGASGGFGLARLKAILGVVGPVLLGALAGGLARGAAGGGLGGGLGSGLGSGLAGAALVASGLLIGAGAARFGQPPERAAALVLVIVFLATALPA